MKLQIFFIIAASGQTIGFIWTAIVVSLTWLIIWPSALVFKVFIVSYLCWMTAVCGPAASVNILGCAMLFLKGIHLVSIVGNVGTLNKTVIEVNIVEIICLPLNFLDFV